MTSYNYSFEKPSRDVHSVFLHCSASDHAHHDNVKTMKTWHLQRGFTDVGYHFFIRKDGTLELGRPLSTVPAAQKGHNTGSIAICLHGLEKAKFTKSQFKTLKALCIDIQNSYKPKNLKFRGHCEVSSKACPVYDYKSVLALDINGYIKATPNSVIPYQCSAPERPATFNLVLSTLMSGDWVKELQTCLSALYSDIKIDGVFGQQTRLATESAQRISGLPVDGELSQTSYVKIVTLRRGDKGGKVKRVQRILKSAGFSISDDGDFGPKTQQTVINFQTKYGLAADGIIGPQTLSQFSKLGLTK